MTRKMRRCRRRLAAMGLALAIMAANMGANLTVVLAAENDGNAITYVSDMNEKEAAGIMAEEPEQEENFYENAESEESLDEMSGELSPEEEETGGENTEENAEENMTDTEETPDAAPGESVEAPEESEEAPKESKDAPADQDGSEELTAEEQESPESSEETVAGPEETRTEAELTLDTTEERIDQLSVDVRLVVSGVLTDVSRILLTAEKESEESRYTFSYPVPPDYAEYLLDSLESAEGIDSRYENGIVSGSGLGLESGRVYTVTVRLTAPTVEYTIRHMASDTGQVLRMTTGRGEVGEMTDAEPEEIEHYMAADIENVLLENSGTEATVTYDPKTYHVYYDSQGGTYVAPKSGIYRTNVEVYKKNRDKSYIPCTPAPAKEGYHFMGWYKDKECTQEADARTTMDKDITVYAKWIEGAANYTILYMKEMLDENNKSYYVYFDSETARDVVGKSVDDSEGKNKKNPGKHYKNARRVESQMLAPDNSTIVYVYYDLKEYDLTFNLENENARIAIGGKEYEGSDYHLKVKLGMNVTDLWSTSEHITVSGNGNGNGKQFAGWTAGQNFEIFAGGHTGVTGEMLSAVSGTSAVYKGKWEDNLVQCRAEYYLQSADGKEYELSEEYSQTYAGSKGQKIEAKRIAGYTNNAGMSKVEESDGITICKFYYDRNRHDIIFRYHDDDLDTQKNIRFGDDISKYKNHQTKQSPDVTADAAFSGWYDNPQGEGKEYSFEKMPDHTLVLYAKYDLPERTVVFHWENAKETMSSTAIVKGNKLRVFPEPERKGYLFIGWRYENGEEFDPYQPISENLSLYAAWEVLPIVPYTIRYVDKAGGVEVSDPAERNGRAGRVVAARAKQLEGYVALEVNKSAELKSEEENEIVFYYRKIEDLAYTVVYRHRNGEDIRTDADLPVLSSRFVVNADLSVIQEQQEMGYVLDGKEYQIFSPDPSKDKDAPENTVIFSFVPKRSLMDEEPSVRSSGGSAGNPSDGQRGIPGYSENDSAGSAQNPLERFSGAQEEKRNADEFLRNDSLKQPETQENAKAEADAAADAQAEAGDGGRNVVAGGKIPRKNSGQVQIRIQSEPSGLAGGFMGICAAVYAAKAAAASAVLTFILAGMAVGRRSRKRRSRTR